MRALIPGVLLVVSRDPLVIRTGPSVSCADVARTLDIVTAAGVTEITFASKQEEE